MLSYFTISGRPLNLGALTAGERRLLVGIYRDFLRAPVWSKFARTWRCQCREVGLSESSVVRDVAVDLEGRLGIAQGRMALPGYRTTLLEAIDEQFGTRSEFCKSAGLDPAQLSRVLAGGADLSMKCLERVGETLGLVVLMVPRSKIESQVTTEPQEVLAALEDVSR